MLVPAPDYSALIPPVLAALESPNSKKAYNLALQRFFRWYGETRPVDGLSRATLVTYREHLLDLKLAPKSVNLALSAIKKLVTEAAENGWLDAPTAWSLSKVPGAKARKTRTGRWLTLEEARKLLALPDTTTLIGKRDSAMLWLLLGCGLRRAEASGVRIEQIEEREGRVILRDVRGKGEKVRIVPVPANGYAAIYDWIVASGFTEGPILRLVHNANPPGQPVYHTVRSRGMDEKAIYGRLQCYAKRLGVPLSPHDLRRTFGALARRGGAEVNEIQRTYGHASSVTTDLYLADCINLEVAPCDQTGL